MQPAQTTPISAITANHDPAAGTAGPENDLQILNLAFVGSLLPGILHNLATPLSGVLGAAQLLEKRASAMKELVALHEELSWAEREELMKHLERNYTNVEILERNSRHLADLLQNIVQRITRGSSGVKNRFPLNELLTSELKFLDANLTFKHKVKKTVILGPDVPPIPYVYGDLASLIDEFVTEVITAHDFQTGLLELECRTDATEHLVGLSLSARPASDRSISTVTLECYLEPMRAAGWHAEVTQDSEGDHLRVNCPRNQPGD